MVFHPFVQSKKVSPGKNKLKKYIAFTKSWCIWKMNSQVHDVKDDLVGLVRTFPSLFQLHMGCGVPEIGSCLADPRRNPATSRIEGYNHPMLKKGCLSILRVGIFKEVGQDWAEFGKKRCQRCKPIFFFTICSAVWTNTSTRKHRKGAKPGY